jgi:hypothetical protein
MHAAADWHKARLLLGERFSEPSKMTWETDPGNYSEEQYLGMRHAADRTMGGYAKDGVTSAEDVEWVKPPMKQHWCYKDTVKAWGNEPAKATWYVAAALIVEVSKYRTGVCAAV